MALVTGAVGVAVVYNTGTCTGRGTAGGEGEGGRGGGLFCFLRLWCRLCFLCLLDFGSRRGDEEVEAVEVVSEEAEESVSEGRRRLPPTAVRINTRSRMLPR